jgi:hypothetical protein
VPTQERGSPKPIGLNLAHSGVGRSEVHRTQSCPMGSLHCSILKDNNKLTVLVLDGCNSVVDLLIELKKTSDAHRSYFCLCSLRSKFVSAATTQRMIRQITTRSAQNQSRKSKLFYNSNACPLSFHTTLLPSLLLHCAPKINEGETEWKEKTWKREDGYVL